MIPTKTDPAGLEPKTLMEMVDTSQAHVLEIGAGDGRLTWRYAAAVRRVTATDPNPERLRKAQVDCPPDLRPRLALTQVKAEALPFPDETFDLAILAWSL